MNHTGLFPSVTTSFNLADGVSLSDATQRINQMHQRLGTPSSMTGFFAGTLLGVPTIAAQHRANPEVLAALVAVYIVLGVLYESLVHPLTIISGLLPVTVGAMLALMLFKEDLNIISIIGIVLLIGIVKKNAIMMIDLPCQAERTEGKSPADSIFEACMLRFRPILTTTMAALFGALPPALGRVLGPSSGNPLGITIVGGIDYEPVTYTVYDAGRLPDLLPAPAAHVGKTARYGLPALTRTQPPRKDEVGTKWS